MLRLWLYRLVRAAPLFGTAATVAWIWAANPFVDPLVTRSAEEIRLQLERLMARRVDADWVDARLNAALADDDLDRAELLAEIATDTGVGLDPGQGLQLQDMRDAAARRAFADCGRCMIDADKCTSLSHIGICLVPFELTPAGDLNALRQEGGAWIAGDEVDELNAGLAVIGLGATAATLMTGGTSAPVKAGATALRVGRRIGALSPRLSGALADLGQIGLKPDGLWRYARGRGPLDEALDVDKLARLEAVGGDLTRVADNTSIADALVLLRRADSTEDIARLARVTEAVGPDSRKYFEALGTRRVFSSLIRLSDIALTAAALIYALSLQLLVPLANWASRRALRGLALVLRPK